MFYLLHFWLSTLHLMKFHYNSKVWRYHCSTCIDYIYLYQNCTGSDFEISTIVSTILVKIDVLDTCGEMICLYFGIVFLLLFKKIENAVYTSFQNSMLSFINGLIFDIMNIQNNQSLEFESIPMLAPLRSVNDQRFSWLCNVFLKSFQDWLNSVQQCQGNFTKDAGQKMFISISWQTYEGLKISVSY